MWTIFGRGFYVLDDYTPLRHLKRETLARPASLFPPRAARIYHELSHVPAAFGNTSMPNPLFGAMLHYHVGEAFPGSDKKFVLAITNAQGESVSRLPGPATAGLHRVVWNLRYSTQSQAQEGRRRRRSGPLVEPGEYRITLLAVVDGQETRVGKSQTLQVTPL
ncbi:MAG: hypothetical protein GY809_20200 [Planctomycetes bacterium]|nr:hypothetical protein [Planctomycetota bacterium]